MWRDESGFGRVRVFLTISAVLVAGSGVACSDDGGGGGPTDPPGDGGNDPSNRPPSAVIQSSHDAVPPGDDNQTVVTLDGRSSSDPDGDELTFQWSVSSATYVGGTGPTFSRIQVTFPGVSPYPVTLTVSDGRGGTDQASFLVDLR